MAAQLTLPLHQENPMNSSHEDAVSVPGLVYVPNFLSAAEQTVILQLIDVDHASHWRGDLIRRVQHYGYLYNYKARKIDATMQLGPLPPFLADLSRRLVDGRWFDRLPEQAIINEYLPGQGISAHVDCVPCFGAVVASLSLGSSCLMDFRHKTDGRLAHQLLEPGSLVVLTGEARYVWTHAIAARLKDEIGKQALQRARRVSITFRTIQPAFSKPRRVGPPKREPRSAGR